MKVLILVSAVIGFAKAIVLGPAGVAHAPLGYAAPAWGGYARPAIAAAPWGAHAPWGAAPWGAPAWGGLARTAIAPAIAAPAWGGVAIAKPAIAAEPYDPNPHYQFSYGVSDPTTGDNKSQQESRSGDVVQGSYSLVEPDGSKRVVEYTADPHNGFNAVVHREPGGHPAIAKVAAPIAYPAGIAYHH